MRKATVVLLCGIAALFLTILEVYSLEFKTQLDIAQSLALEENNDQSFKKDKEKKNV